MSPEYVLGRVFSEKYEDFSFGVLLLEIVYEKKNTSFQNHEKHLRLRSYAWQLWNEGRALDLMDQVLADSFSLSEVKRCIHVGLLCVQDQVADRPTMTAIILMLSSEIDGPQPKQPTFTFGSLLDSGLGCATDTIIQSKTVSVGETLISNGQIFELGFFSPGNSGKQYVGICVVELQKGYATDTIIQSKTVLVGETLISNGQIFELGFFSPGNSGKQYVGIWYKQISFRRAVFVANRGNPLMITSSTSGLTSGDDGNLRIVDANHTILWSTNISVSVNQSVAVLLDKDDPSPGKFVAGIATMKPPEAYVLKDSLLYWGSGLWNGLKFVGMLDLHGAYLNGFNFVPQVQNDDQMYDLVWRYLGYSLGGEDLFLPLANSGLGDCHGKERTKLVISLTIISGVGFLGAITYGLCKWKANQRGKQKKRNNHFHFSDIFNTTRAGQHRNSRRSDMRHQPSELPIFDLEKIVAATKKFSTNNKLWEGGFGPVLKEKIDLMRLTATSQGSVVNDCNVAEKLSHSSALGIKRKDLNGSTSSGQGCCNKDYMSDEDLEEHLRKMKAKSAEMLKKLSEKRYQLLQTYGKSFIPTVQASNAQPCSRYNLKLI
ncbi:hypothetical protein TEA_024990 [Camellia sinensis var. sinensis]|uniref:Bulb-type lectin domain-containing protein n=1 Tax=Camellia sinensis var. sinensis TaxID=542762 RepID=A0A4S4DGA3_CAMSN|nr:hypothetical protein TEA_024990 [Camellia sinensis var. sinensis]